MAALMRQTGGDHRFEDDGLSSEEGGEIARDAVEERAVRDHAVLDDLVQPGAELAAGECVHERRIHRHQSRLMKRANQILALRMIDADFAADRAVDLREQRRWHVDERDAAEICGRGEAGHVADDAAADRNEDGASIGVRPDQRIVDAADGLEVLEALAVSDDDRLVAR